MADLKISQLPAASTPLAGTEVLPVVQGGITEQVSVADLTAGRAVAATSLTVGAGAVGTPSLTTSGDPNTGIFFPAADTVAIAKGGAEAMRINSSGFTQFPANLVMPYQPAPTLKTGAATLTGAELITGILQYSGGNATITLPTGANIEGALTWVGNDVSLDWYVISTGSGTCTIGANGNTTVGSLTVTGLSAAHFRIRRTAANTFTFYRL